MERPCSGMLKGLKLKNYKCHKETPDVEFAPITLLVGPNSSGKTAFLQPLLLLKQTLDPKASSVTPMILDGNYVGLGTFNDIIFDHKPERNLEFKIRMLVSCRSLALPGSVKRKLQQRGLDKLKLDYSIRVGYSKRQKGMILTQVTLSSEAFKFCLDPQRMALEAEVLGKRLQIRERQTKEQSLRGLMNTVPFMIRKPIADIKNGVERVRLLFDEYFFARRIVESLTSTIESVGYIGPVRDYPTRYYVSSGERVSDVGVAGENAIQLLQQDKALGGNLKEELEKWLKELAVAKGVVMRQIDPTLFALEIIGPYTKTKVNITDTGFGVSQIIPAIIQGHLMPPGSTLILEQPEIHLHPRAQACIADLLIELANKQKRFIVETHSEHIILRLQRRVAEKKILSDDVKIYYFDMSETGVNIRQIGIDSRGQLLNFPKGFMEEGLEEAYRTALASEQED